MAKQHIIFVGYILALGQCSDNKTLQENVNIMTRTLMKRDLETPYEDLAENGKEGSSHDVVNVLSFSATSSSSNASNTSLIVPPGDNVTMTCEVDNTEREITFSLPRKFPDYKIEPGYSKAYIHINNVSCIHTGCYGCMVYPTEIAIKVPCEPFFINLQPPDFEEDVFKVLFYVVSYPEITSLHFWSGDSSIAKDSILDYEGMGRRIEYTQLDCSLNYCVNFTLKHNSISTREDITVRISNSVGDLNIIIPKRQVRCPEIEEDGIVFEKTFPGSRFETSCPEEYIGTVSRRCDNEGAWEAPRFTNCTRPVFQDVINKLTSSVTSDTLADVAQNVAEVFQVEYQTIVSGDIKNVAEIFSQIGNSAKQFNLTVSKETMETLTKTVDKLLAADDSVWMEVSRDNVSTDPGAQLLLSMEEITQTIFKSETFTEVTVKTENIELEIKQETTNQIRYPDPKSTERGNEIQFSQIKEETFKYSIIVYKNVSEKFTVQKFTDNKENRAKVPEGTTEVLNSDNKTALKQICSYLVRSSKESTWATDGCETRLVQDKVTCSCQHLTNFAVLMSRYEADETQWSVLSFISAIGISISLVSLSVTIAVYGLMWRYVKSDRSVLNIHLCVVLLIGYIVFIIGISKTENPTTCALIAGLLHFSFLTVFFVMLAQGILILKTVTSVSSTSIVKFLYPLMYGGPSIVVVVSVAVTQGAGYGTHKICWFDPKSDLLWAFVGPAFSVVLVNVVILIAVLRIMQTSHALMDKDVKKKTKSLLRSVCVLTPILGLTWTFGVLSISIDNIVFQYLFAVSNSLQGVLIFIFQCLLQYQVRNGLRSIIRRYRASSSVSSSRVVSSSQERSSSESHVRRKKRSSGGDALLKSESEHLEQTKM
ncbi:adhesion G protein-coupled receptor E3 [Biomphalaria pfeifferi]|uniref:Adhesion G protein-coupled receptor E3 n=1 Tax=Biomphalaria pfeifferi TaxID=112525 RepID=A0AAD8BRJ8_BIOPF|nr:adhesion G protein-coupled receptor E3 [Biomphalaria pfeifferi]